MIKKSLFGILIVITLTEGCKKSMEDLNVNPNQPTSINPDYMFTSAVVKGMGSYQTNVQFQYWNLMNWTMCLATLKGVESGKEYLPSDGKNNLWSEMYSGSLINAQEVINSTQSNTLLSNKTNIARIWKAYIFQRITDLWGAMPYSEALKGGENGNFKPAYDIQEKIYLLLLDELKNAALALDKTKITFPGTSDPIYSGDVLKWQAFANSLRFRIAIRLTDSSPLKMQDVISELTSTPLLSSNTENAIFPYNNTIKNPFYEVILLGQGAGKMYPSRFLIEMLSATSDPRLKIFAQPTLESQVIGFDIYDGVPNLVPANSTIWNAYQSNGSNVSSVGKWFQNSSSPGMVLSYSEVCFLKAEAALAGNYPGNAQQFYEDGIRANMQSYGDSISGAEIITYLSQVPAVSLENIITQKWLSFTFQNAYEAFAEYRRTGFPVLKDFTHVPINTTDFPNRITYPPLEVTLNIEHLSEAIQAQGPDQASTKLWWDKY